MITSNGTSNDTNGTDANGKRKRSPPCSMDEDDDQVGGVHRPSSPMVDSLGDNEEEEDAAIRMLNDVGDQDDDDVEDDDEQDQILLNDAQLLESIPDDVDYDEHPDQLAHDYKKLWDQEWGLSERIDQLLRDIARLSKFPGPYWDMVLSGDEDDDDFDEDFDEEDDEEYDANQFDAPQWCIPIKANVMNFDWESLGKEMQFDVIMADPPWQLATHAPTRGVAISYQQLPDICIEDLPIDKLQTSGFIFIWVINNKYAKAFEMMEKWGYHYVDDVTWVKQTVNRRMAKGHGYYLQHAKETCLVGAKGDLPPYCRRSVGSDVIYSERRGQSQKPEEIYELIESLMPGGKYLEIFGRKNNLRDYWVTVGNEL